MAQTQDTERAIKEYLARGGKIKVLPPSKKWSARHTVKLGKGSRDYTMYDYSDADFPGHLNF